MLFAYALIRFGMPDPAVMRSVMLRWFADNTHRSDDLTQRLFAWHARLAAVTEPPWTNLVPAGIVLGDRGAQRDHCNVFLPAEGRQTKCTTLCPNQPRKGFAVCEQHLSTLVKVGDIDLPESEDESGSSRETKKPQLL